MQNIILIGMPGCGKTTVGTYLSEYIGYGYIDSDSVIVAREGMRLPEIIEKKGREAFLDIEAKVNSELCADRCVIATGGSAVLSDEAMKHFREMGKIVFLDVDLATLSERVGDLDERGVVRHKGQSFENLFEERLPLYRKYADITVGAKGDAGDMAKEIAEIVK